MKKIVFVFCLVVIFYGCYDREKIIDKQNLLGRDFRLFQNTPAWTLAKAVQDEDVVGIKKEIEKNNVDPDFQEPKYGGTLLMLAIYNNKYRSTQLLLELGANPNLRDVYRGASAMIDASENKNSKYLRLLLEYNGNPNSVENAPIIGNKKIRNAPLNVAISCFDCDDLEKVKLLVNVGANINYYKNDQDGFTRLPLADALMLSKMNVTLYLLEHGADYNKVLYTTVNNKDVYILGALRRCVFDLKSNDYITKKKIISFLQHRSLDYEKEPIPDSILSEIQNKYPDDWNDYLKKY